MPEPGVIMASSLTDDTTPVTVEEAALYRSRCQELEQRVEAQQKIISDYEAAQLNTTQRMADLRSQLSYREQVLIIFIFHVLILS